MASSDFVRDTLTKWKLSNLIKIFEDQEINEESFLLLTERDIECLIPTIGPRIIFRNRHNALVKNMPSTSMKTPLPGKRKSDVTDANKQSKKQTHHATSGTIASLDSEKNTVKKIMENVRSKLDEIKPSTKLTDFLRDKIKTLEKDRKQIVGVFGKTGSGKSSLINAILGVNLLPSGAQGACTTVMIQMEANMTNDQYIAEVEFITMEDWRNELWPIVQDKSCEAKEDKDKEHDEEEDCIYDDEKITALYGKDAYGKDVEEIMDRKNFSEVPEFYLSRRKLISCNTAEELSEKITYFTRSDTESVPFKQHYWPLVKCLTIKVPNCNELLEHVVLVDLPGNGDCNKSRDEMWKSVTMVDKWSVDDTCHWLQTINLIDSKECFREQQIDGETLLGLTERMVERLFPVMKQQVTFMKELNKLKNLETEVPQLSCTQQEPCENEGSFVAQPWPAVYNLPVFPPELQAALQRKDPGFKKKDKSHIRALLIQVLFDSITKHTWYPNHKMYGDVLGSLITCFTFLKDGSSSGYDTLLECLRNKFKKERIPLVSSSIVLQMKEKYGIKRKCSGQTDSEGVSQQQENAKCRRQPLDIMAYNDSACSHEVVLDLEVMGEDETSFREHINAITLELRKSNPSYSEVKNRMKRTLFKRVQIMDRAAAEVMEQFPFLGVPQLMLHEMTMRFGTDLAKNMEISLNEMAPNIIRSAKEGRQRKLYANLIGSAEENTEGLVRNAALILLPALFKENASFLYCVDGEPKGPTPTIVFNGSPDPLKAESVSIIMDNVNIIREADIDMTQAVECLFAVFFLFNVKYPVDIKHTMTFIQKYMLKLRQEHDKTTPIPVLKMYSQLV